MGKGVWLLENRDFKRVQSCGSYFVLFACEVRTNCVHKIYGSPFAAAISI